MAHSHEHDVKGLSDRRIGWTVALNVLLTIGEIIGGALAGSIALVADALHNLNDAAALLITLFARRISRQQPDEQYTFGYKRAKVIGGLINLVALVVVGLFLAYESVLRFFQPREEIGGWIIIGAAGLALVVDVLTVLLLYGLRKGSVNTRSAFVHNLADALASLAVLLGGVAILIWNIRWIDPLLSLGISAYILYQGYKMIPSTVKLLMESAPDGLDFEKLVAEMKAVEGVEDVHHVHVWQLSEEDNALEAHVVIKQADAQEMTRIKTALRQMLGQDFDIGHATLELELPGAAHEHDTSVIRSGI